MSGLKFGLQVKGHVSQRCECTSQCMLSDHSYTTGSLLIVPKAVSERKGLSKEYMEVVMLQF